MDVQFKQTDGEIKASVDQGQPAGRSCGFSLDISGIQFKGLVYNEQHLREGEKKFNCFSKEIVSSINPSHFLKMYQVNNNFLAFFFHIFILWPIWVN